MASTNKNIMDETLRHEISLIRLTGSAQKDALGMLIHLEKDIKNSIHNINPLKPKQARYRRERLQKLYRQVINLINSTYHDISTDQAQKMLDLARWDHAWSRSIIKKQVGIELGGLSFSTPLLRNLISNTMIEGAPSKEWWKKQSRDVTQKFKNEMRMGMMEGESIQKITNRITERVMPVSKRSAQTLVRTSFHAVSQKARYETFKDMDDVVKEFQWLSTLDTRTSDVCIARSGKLYDMDLKPIGHNIPALGGPPAHFNCRSTLLPITKSWEELGIKTKKKIEEFGTGTQSSMDGQVPGDLTYQEWLKSQPEEVQKEVLGRYRQKMWKKGEIKDLSQLVDQTGRSLTIPQLLSQKIPGPASSLPSPVYAEQVMNVIKNMDGVNISKISVMDRDQQTYWAKYNFDNQEITVLSGTRDGFDLHKELESAFGKMAKGEALTEQEENAMASLWHEMLHSQQAGLAEDTRKGALVAKYKQDALETVTDWTAARTYPTLMKKFGAEARFVDKIKVSRIGYADQRDRFDELLHLLKLKDTDVLKYVQKDMFEQSVADTHLRQLTAMLMHFNKSGLDIDGSDLYQTLTMIGTRRGWDEGIDILKNSPKK